MNKYILLFSLNLIFATNLLAWEACDTVRHCLGNALTLSVTSGRGAHYVDVKNTNSQKYFRSAFTFELWMKPEPQPGKTQFIAGLWGPSADKNDAWVIYFNQSDELVFEINSPSTNQKSLDNTIIKIPGAIYYSKWSHLAAVFDGSSQTISLYINGLLVGSSRNAQYPANRLRDIVNKELPIQIGSCNGLSDSSDYRTFLGQMDEIRMWAKPLSQNEIYCQKDRSLIGTEDSLMLYYRCNELPDLYLLCDATGNGNFGEARSGASCRQSNRTFTSTLSASPLNVKDTIICATSRTYRFTVVDTSICQNQVWMRVIDSKTYQNVPLFKITPPNTFLNQNQAVSIDVALDAKFTGTQDVLFQIIPYNSCRTVITIPMKITRITELSYSHMNLNMDTLIAHCVEKPYIDSVIRICNNTSKLGNPRNIKIDRFQTNNPGVFYIVGQSLPLTIKPDECIDVTLRFKSGNVTAAYFDTLKVISDDKCEGAGLIPLKGVVREAFALTLDDGKTRVDSIDFKTECVNFASDVFNYIWKNLIDKDITVDTIIFPQHFVGRTFKYPVTLRPKTGYLPNYFRFVPKAAGIFNDSIVFIVKAGGCTVKKPVYVQGKGLFADLRFVETSVDFGNVIVGQEKEVFVSIKNYSTDTLTFSVYLRKGEVFFLTGAKSFKIAPGATVTFPLSFIPIEGLDYFDELCLFERRCFKSACIPINGKGIEQIFGFEPPVMKIENVIGCRFSESKLVISNISSSEQLLTSFVLDDPSGNFSLINPPALPASINLMPSQSIEFTFRYTPADVINDRADWAYLRYQNNGIDWSGKLYGTSISPKIYVSGPIDYGTLEIGDRKIDTIIIENISPVPVKIDSIEVPDGYVMLYPNYGMIGRNLGPRDSLRVIVEFRPQIEKDYTSFLNVYASEPCTFDNTTLLMGRGIIVPLEVSIAVLSFGFVPPCDCTVREIPFVNQSLVNEMVIDSLWIDDFNVVNAWPEFFSWTSYYSPSGTLPYNIPAWSRDTVKVKFCPGNPSERSFIDNSARLHVKAHGVGWEREYSTYLTGKRTLLYEPMPILHEFPPTRVDTFSIPKYAFISIPETSVNPDQLPVTIDSIGFLPDERVFFAKDSLGRPFPITINGGDTLILRIDFKPRAVRTYEAKLILYTSKPCQGLDTTIVLRGNSFAPAFGLEMTFETGRQAPDTMRVINCDTLTVPIFTSRKIPGDLIDIQSRLAFDSTKLEFLYADSPYLADTCNSFAPKVSWQTSSFGGIEILAKNLCNVDSTRPYIIAHFRSLVPGPDTLSLAVDSIKFDTEGVILFHLIAEPDYATVIIQRPLIESIDSASFDSVRVLDCVSRQLHFVNTGDVPLSLNDILQLPQGVRILSAIPGMSVKVEPGDTIMAELEFCPRKKGIIDTTVIGQSIDPCILLDSTYIRGTGYAPRYEFGVDISNNFFVPDTIGATIGDTIWIPIIFEKDLSTDLNGTIYWLEALAFKLGFNYNPAALKYLDYQKSIDAVFEIANQPGQITFKISKADSIQAGEILRMQFLAVVPDSVYSSIHLDAYDFQSDSLMFLELIPMPDSAKFVSTGKCNLTTINYSPFQNYLAQNSPNPFSEQCEIEFSLMGKSQVFLRIKDMQGKTVADLINGQTLAPGIYKANFNADYLPSGMYLYTIETIEFTDTKKMLIVR